MQPASEWNRVQQPMSGSDANKAIVRRYFDMFNSGDLTQLADIVSQDYGDKLNG